MIRILPRALAHIGGHASRNPAPDMAAVLALVFLFALASVGLLFRVFVGDATLTSMLTFALFFAMATGVFVGCFKMARTWEGDPGH